LYWEFTQPNAPYGVLLDWWSKHTYGKHCYIGLGIYRAGSSAAWKDPTLLPRQIQALRDASNVQGAIYFSSKSFIKNPLGWNDSLQNNYYYHPALIPPMEWIDSTKPAKPVVELKSSSSYNNAITIEISKQAEDKDTKAFVIYTFLEDSSDTTGSIYKIIPSSGQVSVSLPYFELVKKRIAVTSVSRNNNESELQFLKGREISTSKN